MEKKQAETRSEFAQKWKVKELRYALVLAIGSIGLMIGALSISLVGQVEGSEMENVRVNGLLDRGKLTIDPELQPNESLLVTVPDSVEMMAQSVRMADGNLEPPFIHTLDVPPSVWEDLEYLLTIVSGDEITEYQCEVDPESILFEGNEVNYELECELAEE